MNPRLEPGGERTKGRLRGFAGYLGDGVGTGLLRARNKKKDKTKLMIKKNRRFMWGARMASGLG